MSAGLGNCFTYTARLKQRRFRSRQNASALAAQLIKGGVHERNSADTGT